MSRYRRDVFYQVCHHGGAPILFVKGKQDETLRLCIDYHELNKTIIQKQIPFILNKRYHQRAVTPQTSPKPYLAPGMVTKHSY